MAYLTTVDSSLRYLLLPQLTEIVARGGTSIGISAPRPDVSFLLASGIEHRPLSASTRSASLGGPEDRLAALAALAEEPIDVLHTHNPKPGVYGRILGRLAGVPLVVNTVHGFYATETDGFLKRAVVYLMEAVAAVLRCRARPEQRRRRHDEAVSHRQTVANCSPRERDRSREIST